MPRSRRTTRRGPVTRTACGSNTTSPRRADACCRRARRRARRSTIGTRREARVSNRSVMLRGWTSSTRTVIGELRRQVHVGGGEVEHERVRCVAADAAAQHDGGRPRASRDRAARPATSACTRRSPSSSTSVLSSVGATRTAHVALRRLPRRHDEPEQQREEQRDRLEAEPLGGDLAEPTLPGRSGRGRRGHAQAITRGRRRAVQRRRVGRVAPGAGRRAARRARREPSSSRTSARFASRAPVVGADHFFRIVPSRAMTNVSGIPGDLVVCASCPARDRAGSRR